MQGLAILARNRLRLTLAAGAVAGAVVLWAGAGTSIDEWLGSARAGFRFHAASGNVVIAEIDEKSIGAIYSWPWPRRIHAAAIDRLREAGARQIAFDVDFSSPSTPEDDASLAAALKRAGGTVILPVFSQQAASGSQNLIDSAPVPALTDHAFLAAANVLPDPDGRLRRMPYALEILGAPRPSLAALVAEKAASAATSFRLDTAIDPLTIPRISIIDLIQGRVPPAALRGKRVIVGGTAVELGDRYAMPRHRLLPGVVAQAVGAETLLAGNPPKEASGAWGFLLALLLLCAAVATPNPKRAFGLGFVGTASLVVLQAVAHSGFGIFLPLAPALVALGLGGAVAAASFAAARYRERLLVDAETALPNLQAFCQSGGEGQTAVTAARIDGYATLVAAVGAEQAAGRVARLAETLRFTAGGADICRIEAGVLAWREPAKEGVEQRLEALAAVMRASDLHVHLGAALGDALDMRRLAGNAALAAAAAAEARRPWQLFTARDSEAASWSVALVSELDVAMREGRMWTAYQPKLDLRTGHVVGVEALVRWDHAERGALAPDSFVPLIEQSGRIADLTLHVLGQSLTEGLDWQRSGRRISIAVNVSATLLNDHAAMLRLQEAVLVSGFDPSLLTIEVTETAAMADPDRAIAALRGWRALGAGVSIDDYGTGQSSLAYLQKLPATEIKIDRSFVATIASETRNAIMVRSTIAMAHELGLKVVAEGVEDEACLAALREMGCDLAQGYWIARPMTADAVAPFAASRAAAPRDVA